MNERLQHCFAVVCFPDSCWTLSYPTRDERRCREEVCATVLAPSGQPGILDAAKYLVFFVLARRVIRDTNSLVTF